jgi:hypothetical protein
MSYIDEIKKTRLPTNPPTKGLVWMSMLIEYDYNTGKSTIIRSISTPAKESKIKGLYKQKDKGPKIEIEENVESENLF